MTAWRTISIELAAETSKLEAGLRRGQQALGDFAQRADRALNVDKLDRFGSDMTRKVTLPLVALGTGAGKMAADFETTFSQMVGLAEVPAAEVDHLRESVMSLAGDTAVAPQALAEALYAAASAGLTASEAMAATEVAAKGQAAGLGQVQDLVSLVASATAAYGAENINAAKTVDILTETIRAGSADPDELAGSLGRTLAVAAQLGITFDEVGAVVAELSTAFGNTDIAVTNMSALFMELVQPSKQAADALEAAGTSSAELKETISERGLLGGLELLRDKGFASNDEALGKLFGNMRSYQAAATLLGLDSEKLAATFEQTANAAGSLDEALGEAMGTDAHKARQAIVDLQVALIQLGEQILPVAAAVLGFVVDLAGAFSSLPDPMQKALLVLAGFAAAAGPVAKGVAGVAKGIDLVSRAAQSKALDSFRLGLMGVGEAGAGAGNKLGSLIARMGGLGTVAGVAGLGLVGVGSIMAAMADDAANAARRTAMLESEISTLVATASAAGQTIEEAFVSSTLVDWFAENAELAKRFGVEASDLAAALLSGEDAVRAYLASLTDVDLSDQDTVRLAAAFELLNGTLAGGKVSADAIAAAQKDLASAGHDVAGAQANMAGQVDGATSEIDEQADAVKAVSSAFDNWQSAAAGVTTAQDRLASAQKSVTSAQRQVADAAKSVADAQRAVQDAARGMADAQQAAALAAAELLTVQREQAEGSKEVERANRGVEDAEKALAQAQRDSKTAQDGLNEARATAAERLADLEQAVTRQGLTEREARLALAEAQQRISELDGDSTGNERERAAIALQRAEWRLADVLEENAKREAQLATEREKGVEASDEVTAAHERIEQAADRERRAEESLVEAQAAVAQAHEDMARRVEEAQRKVAEANDRVEQAAQRVTDATDRVREAQQRVVDAKQGVVDAHESVAKAARDVEQAHLDAYLAQVKLRQEMEQNPGALRTYREDLEKLAEELGPNAPARRRLDELIARIREAEGRHEVEMAVTITGPDRAFLDASGMSIVGRRWGGIHETARWGRLPDLGAQVVNNPTILFGERETGGEAMIPRHGDPFRSRQVLSQAAGWYGLDVTDRAQQARGSGMSAAMFAQAVAATSSGSSGPLFSDGAIRVETGASIDPQAVGVMAAATIAAKLAATGVR